MTAFGLGGVWAGVVVAFAWRHRPAPARTRSLTPAVERHRAPRRGVREFVGIVVLRSLRIPPDGERATKVGGAVIAGVAALAVVPVAAAPAACVGWAVPSIAARRIARRADVAVLMSLPDVVDLLALAVGAGLTVLLALEIVARRGRGPVADEFAQVCREVRMGRRLADALDDIPGRVGEGVRPVVTALVASERYGAPLVDGLERLSDEVRRDRRRRADEAARRVPVKLLFPLVTCTLPAFALLTVAPLIVSSAGSLRL